MFEKILLLLSTFLGLVAIGIAIYTIIKQKKSIIRKGPLSLVFSILNLALGLVLFEYINFKDTASIIDVGGALQRMSFVLWLVLAILTFIYSKKIHADSSNFKFMVTFSLLLVFTQYFIAYYMLANASGFDNAQSLPSPIIFIMIINLINVFVIYYQLKNEK